MVLALAREEAARSLRTLLDDLEGLRIFDIESWRDEEIYRNAARFLESPPLARG